MSDNLSIAELYDLLETDAPAVRTPALVELVGDASRRLAVYGTLAPGRPNHHVVEPLDGVWSTGWVRGHLFDSGRGAAAGYPGVVLDRGGPGVPIDLLVSDDLPSAWRALDRFEGPGYRRALAPVLDQTGGLVAVANIYVLIPDATPR